LNHVETPKYDNTEKKLKIDPYKILDISKNYDERSLKKAYLKMANKTHPDKGGDPNKFKIVTLAYKVLMKKLSQKDNDKIHNELKKNSENFLKPQSSDNKQNINMKGKNFNMEVFNREFDQNKSADEFADNGYGDWFKKDTHSNQPTKKLNKNNFNDEFQRIKSKQCGSQLQKYTEPKELVSMSNADSILVLGKEKVKSYTGESNGLHYRDLKEAYEEPTLIDVNSVNISDRENNIEGYNRQRKNVKFQMSQGDMEKQALKLQREEQDEKNRIRRLSERDEQSRVSYERIHQRLMGS
jgi:curved DNA-binding protein CbpA